MLVLVPVAVAVAVAVAAVVVVVVVLVCQHVLHETDQHKVNDVQQSVTYERYHACTCICLCVCMYTYIHITNMYISVNTHI